MSRMCAELLKVTVGFWKLPLECECLSKRKSEVKVVGF